MKLEIHSCDRCGDEIRVPESTVCYIVLDYSEATSYFEGRARIEDDPNDLTYSTAEICSLCLSALEYAFRGIPIPTNLEGVVKHEETFRKRIRDES